MKNFPLFPEGASSVAGRVDTLFWTLTAFSGLLTVAVFGLIIYFSIKYRSGSSRVPAPAKESRDFMEYIWTSALFLISLALFIWASALYFRLYRIPEDSIQIFVVAKQWMWKIQHPEGRREINELHIPLDRNVKLTMVSQDVIHSFYVPAFRVKRDVLPGRYQTFWFRAIKPGSYHLFCAEYCGTKHSYMWGTVTAMPEAEYTVWLRGEQPQLSMSDLGATVFESRGCIQCHGQVTTRLGPNLKGLFGRMVSLQDGSRILADDAYIRESIVRPRAKQVAGFPMVMPSYENQLSEEEMNQLVVYIKSLPQ